MKVLAILATIALGSCAATSATTVATATTASTVLAPSSIPARCNALASMRCEGRPCQASDAWTRPAIAHDRGRVSYYADSLDGNRTASGDRYDRDALTAASRTLPFGTLLRIHRVDRPEVFVVVRVNDRGPFGRSRRILDLSRAAAACIDMIRAGVVEVEAEVIQRGP